MAVASTWRIRNLLKLFWRLSESEKSLAVFAASVGHVAGGESTQGFYHTNYTPRACPGAMGIKCRPPELDHELSATHPEIPCGSGIYNSIYISYNSYIPCYIQADTSTRVKALVRQLTDDASMRRISIRV